MKNLPAGLLRDAARVIRSGWVGSSAAERLRATTESTMPGSDDPTSVLIADAALRQFELFGLMRATIEDIARRARVGRVTVYRHFLGKDGLIEAVTLREVRKFLAELDSVVMVLDDPEERIVEGFVFTLQAARQHRLLQRMIDSEPEMALPWLTTQGASLIAAATEYLAAHMARDLDDDRGGPELLETAEIVVRLIVSFLLTPKVGIDLNDDACARAFARRYLRPMLAASDGTLTPKQDQRQ